MVGGAGSINRRLSFEKRILVDDGYGNTEADYAEAFVRWGKISPSIGVETVTAARLTGQQPVDITVRYDPETKGIEADWRVVDMADNKIYELKSPPAEVAYHTWLILKGVAVD